jgi:hypothetical protein
MSKKGENIEKLQLNRNVTSGVSISVRFKAVFG